MFQSLFTGFFVLMMFTGSLESLEESVQSYVPPYFTDNRRLEKISALIPEIQKMYQVYAETNHFPGYAFGILVDGQLAFSGGGGFIDLNQKTPVTPQSMFRIASMTKSFTAMAILKLRDEKRLNLDDPISDYIPELKDIQLTKDAPPITIRDLLTHSEGFPTDDPWADRKLDESNEQFLALLKSKFYVANVPGITMEYSNLGYAILGNIIRKITSVSPAQYIDQMLGLPGIAWEFQKIPNQDLVHGYKWIDDSWREEPMLHDGAFGPMGGIFASIESFSRYAALHLLAWPPRDDIESGPIKRSSIREMHQPLRFRQLKVEKYSDGRERVVTTAYGYGLNWVSDQQKRVFVEHSGGLPGFGSHWVFMPEYGIGLILFANLTYAPVAKINFEVLDRLLIAAQLNPRQLPPSKFLREMKNSLVDLLPNWDKAQESGLFAANFFLDNSLEVLKRETNNWYEKVGEIVSIGDVIAVNQLHGYFIVKGKKSDLRVDFQLTPENPPLIQQIRIKCL